MPPVEIAYIGAVVPEDERYYSRAVSRAGNLFQLNLVRALAEAGMPPSLILSARPLVAFPSGPLRLVRGECISLGRGLAARLLPFLNVLGVRELMVGAGLLWNVGRWSWARRGRRRVIYCYNLHYPPGLAVFLAARMTGTRLVVAANDVPVPGETIPSSLLSRLDYALHRWLLPRCDALTVVSTRIVSELAPGVPHLRLEGGVSREVLDAFEGDRQAERGEGAFTAVFAGSLTPANGIGLMLDAFERLPPGIRLVIAGRGPLEPEVAERARRLPNVEFHGFVSTAEVLELYRSADLLLCIRATQGLRTEYFFPSKLLEYLASGVPVLCTETGHVREEYGEVLFLASRETPEGIASRIAEIAALPASERRAVGRAGREFVATRKTWRTLGARVADLLRSTAGVVRAQGVQAGPGAANHAAEEAGVALRGAGVPAGSVPADREPESVTPGP